MKPSSAPPRPINAEELSRIPEQGYWAHASQLFREIMKKEREIFPDEGETEHMIFTLSTLYLAGMIDGIRAERAKRRTRQNGGE